MACKCGSEYIVNKKYNLCQSCNHLRIHKETEFDTFINKEQSKVRVYQKQEEKLLRAKKKPVDHSISIRTKEKREIVLAKDEAVYLKVFLSRPHECEECGRELPSEWRDDRGNINCIGQYSHILSKGSCPEFRHDSRNFNRLCPNPCHDRWEFHDKENMNIYKKNQETIQTLLDERNNARSFKSGSR